MWDIWWSEERTFGESAASEWISIRRSRNDFSVTYFSFLFSLVNPVSANMSRQFWCDGLGLACFGCDDVDVLIAWIRLVVSVCRKILEVASENGFESVFLGIGLCPRSCSGRPGGREHYRDSPVHSGACGIRLWDPTVPAIDMDFYTCRGHLIQQSYPDWVPQVSFLIAPHMSTLMPHYLHILTSVHIWSVSIQLQLWRNLAPLINLLWAPWYWGLWWPPCFGRDCIGICLELRLHSGCNEDWGLWDLSVLQWVSG